MVESFGILAADGELCGYVHAIPNGAVLSVELALAPNHRAGGCAKLLLGELAERSAARGFAEIGLWVHTDDVAELVSSMNGWELARSLVRMEMTLPPGGGAEFPSGTTVRGFRLGKDESAWLELNNEAFSGHLEQGGWSRRDLEQRFSYEWFDPLGLRMAWSNGELVAFNWTKLSSPRSGEIYVIASSPALQGKGLGKAIALDGLWDLYARRRVKTAALHVDMSNAPAIRLYEAIGFHPRETHRFYTRKLDTAPSDPPQPGGSRLNES